MKGYIAIIASIMMLATTAALGRDRAAAPTGIGEAIVHGYTANDGIQAAWATPYGMDQKTPGVVQASATASAPAALVIDRRGSTMHRPGGSFGHLNRGQSFHSRPFGSHSFDRNRSFHFDRNRSFHFDRNRSFHRDFQRHHFVPRHRFFDRSHLFFRHYPYRYYYPYYPYRYYYPYGYYYGNLGSVYPYPYSYFYFSW